MKTYDVYSSMDGANWNHHTTTTDPDFISYLNTIDDVLYWKAEPTEYPIELKEVRVTNA